VAPRDPLVLARRIEQSAPRVSLFRLRIPGSPGGRLIRAALGAAALLLPAGFALAVSAAKPPAPGVERERLHYFVGTWQFRLEMKTSPFGPAGLVTGTDRNELLPGGFFLLRRYETKAPVGEIRGIEVVGWDDAAQEYFQRGFDSAGGTHLYRGRVDGQTWTWTYEASAAGRDYQVRIRIREASPALQAYRSELSKDGRSWTTALEGTLTQVGTR
jgi:hypothetical protein